MLLDSQAAQARLGCPGRAVNHTGCGSKAAGPGPQPQQPPTSPPIGAATLRCPLERCGDRLAWESSALLQETVAVDTRTLHKAVAGAARISTPPGLVPRSDGPVPAVSSDRSGQEDGRRYTPAAGRSLVQLRIIPSPNRSPPGSAPSATSPTAPRVGGRSAGRKMTPQHTCCCGALS